MPPPLHHTYGNQPTPLSSLPPAPPLQVPTTTRPRRDPQTEKSKKAFYGVRNGPHGHNVYSFWPECAKDIFNMATQSYHPGTQFKRFDSYTLAYLYSIGVDDPVDKLRTNPSILTHMTPPEENMYSNLVPPPYGELSDILNNDKIPSDVSYSQISNATISSDFHTSMMRERNLPRYTGVEDLSIFLHKLKPILERPDINNYHLDPSTNHENLGYLFPAQVTTTYMVYFIYT